MQSTPRRPVVEVRVELKAGVMDAEAESVQKSLGLLGIQPITAVRTAKVFTLEFGEVDRDRAKELAREAVDRLLANPVIHRVSVAVLPT
ncbi:MAG TPA: phosphoribosylformylglycinamidine synthase subunit PurS [Thermoplasmata archaeon]